MQTIVFDIGATKMRFALSDSAGVLQIPIRRSTPEKFDDAWKEIVAIISELVAQGKGQGDVVQIVGGIRGVLAPDHSRIMHESRLINWINKPLAGLLEERFGVPVHLENDTALAGLGEAAQGAGKGNSIVAFHTISTGVGGVRIVDKKIDVAHIGFEPGRQILDIDGSILHDGITHSLEHLISGSALAQRHHKAPYEISQDNPIWEESAQYLAHGLYNTVMYWSPDVIVLGGPMVLGSPSIPLARIIHYTRKLLGDNECPPIVPALLGDDAGLVGASFHAQSLAHDV